MQNPLISVIVPVYNVEDWLVDCVNSIQVQTYNNIEIILVDDGSTDASGEICDRLANEDDRIFVVHKENGGLSDARNKGIDLHHGEYICFVDSDDLIEKKYVETLYRLITSGNYQVAQIGTKVVSQDNKKVLYTIAQQKDGNVIKLNQSELCKELLLVDVHIAAWCNMYKSFLFDRVRFTKGKLNEDFLMWSDLIDLIDTIVISDECLYRYRMRSGSIVHSNKHKLYSDCLSNSKVWLQKVKNTYPFAKHEADFNYLFYLEMFVKSSNFNEYSLKERNYLIDNYSMIQIMRNKYLNIKQKIYLCFLRLDMKRVITFLGERSSKNAT